MLTIPLFLSFDDFNSSEFDVIFFKSFQTIDTVFDFVFLLDILLNFNTAIYVKGEPVYDRRIIIQNYLEG
jgi:hypothetical protein